MKIIDCHVHVCPDNLAERNKEIIKRFSGITPAYDGSIRQLLSMMQENHVSRAIINNTVLKSELMSKANDFTSKVAIEHPELIAMAWIIPGIPGSVPEVERCKKLNFVGVKMHNSHFKVMPTDHRNDKIYEKIVEHGLPVLFHCGRNPYSASEENQYAMPRSFLDVIKSFPKMKVVLGHLAGYQEDRKGAIEAINASNNVYADLALDPRKPVDLESVLGEIGSNKLIFGSDYPIHEPSDILQEIARLDEHEAEALLSSNSEVVFNLT